MIKGIHCNRRSILIVDQATVSLKVVNVDVSVLTVATVILIIGIYECVPTTTLTLRSLFIISRNF